MESEDPNPETPNQMRVRPHNAAFSFERVIKSCAPTLVKCLRDLGAREGPLSVRQFSHNEKCLVFRVGMDTSQIVAKVFDRDNPDTVWSFEREISVARRISDTGLSPALLHVSEDTRMAVFSYQRGSAVSEALTSENVQIFAEQIGRWLREFYGHMPKREAKAGWIDYLSRYNELDASYIDDYLNSMSEHYTISSAAIARNDMHLSNFLVGEDNALFGLDFEASAFKPVGWDILLAARVLSHRFPEQIDTIAKSLVAGWGGDVGDVPAPKFERLCGAFVGGARSENTQRTAFSMNNARVAYNELSKKKSDLPQVDVVASVPHGIGLLEENGGPQIALLRSHLMREAVVALEGKPSSEARNSDKENPADPSPLMQAACALCQGRCCAEGLERHAFLDADVLGKFARSQGGLTAQGICGAYLEFLPEQRVRGSCNFHSESGCALPRPMRSDICNRFKCKSAKFIDALPPENINGSQPTLLVSTEQGKCRRSAILSKTMFRAVDVADLR
jgi:hypothetical protein